MPGKGKAIASMCCGIAGLVCAWESYGAIVGLVLGIVALCLASSAAKEGNESGMRKAGYITGLIAVILSAVVFACSVIAAIACAGAVGAGALGAAMEGLL